MSFSKESKEDIYVQLIHTHTIITEQTDIEKNEW